MSDAPLPTAEEACNRFLAELVAGVNLRSLYAADHPSIAQGVGRVLAALERVCEARGREGIDVLLIGGDLVVDDIPFRQANLYQQHLVETLRRRGIERLTLARGLDASECRLLLEALSAGSAFPSSPHVVVGHVEINVRETEEVKSGPEKPARPEGVTEEQVASAKEAFARFRGERRLQIPQMEEVVWGLIDVLGRSTDEVMPLAPLKSYDEYTFVHSVNVSMLTLAQARAFGFDGSRLHAIGLAALLHDVGKLDIPLEVLNKPGRLDESEWSIMKAHSELGAWNLSGLEASAPLSILVAYEHHLRFDGEPNYPVLKTPRRPMLASQMTSIADTYDALCTTRPYKTALDSQIALGFLRERAGTFYDPVLVGSFHRLLGEKPGEGAR
jgi:HD-GYP domain-containing protein (c-di-GMP phosphodiesterase class II)